MIVKLGANREFCRWCFAYTANSIKRALPHKDGCGYVAMQSMLKRK